MSMSDSVPFGWALALGAVAAAADVLGGMLIVQRRWSRRFLTYFIALGAGFMLAVAFLEMFPESVRQLYRAGAELSGFAGDVARAGTAATKASLLMLVGYLVVHLFEHTLAPHFHFGEETHRAELAPAHASYAALLGLLIHTFFDGVAIASGLLVSGWLGGIIFVAVFLHKFPEGFTVASLMEAGGQSRKTALAAAGLLGGATLAGVLLMYGLRTAVSWALPLSAGVTVYVAASDLIPEVNREPGVRMAMLVFLGVAVMLLLRHLLHF